MIGDHIRARKNGRWSHAIDCGDATVIHLLEDPAVPPGDRVQRTYRPQFVAGAEAVEIVTHRERVFLPRQVVARAFSPRRDPAIAAMFKDSEGFAAWCKTGRVLEVRNVAKAAPTVRAKPAPAVNTQPKAGAGRTGEKADGVTRTAKKKVSAPQKPAKKKASTTRKPALKVASTTRKPALRKASAARKPAVRAKAAAAKSGGRKGAPAKRAPRKPAPRSGKARR